LGTGPCTSATSQSTLTVPFGACPLSARSLCLHEERGTPLFVKREFERFVRCGVLAHGFHHVLPRAPVRQWVLSSPFELHYRLACDKVHCHSCIDYGPRFVLNSTGE
jgi:hypothetical protein